MVLEWIESGNITGEFWKNFAFQLANIHQQKGEKFGLDHHNYMGQLFQKNSFFLRLTSSIIKLIKLSHN